MEPLLPFEPSARKAVMVLSQHDVERCEYDPRGAEALTDAEIAVLPFPIATGSDVTLALRNILDRNIARPGELLVQSPFDPDEYAPAVSASEQFALEKHMAVSMLCQLLGAKSFWVEQIDLRTSSGSASLEVKGSKGPATASTSIESEQLEAFRRRMSLDVRLKGGPPDLDGAERLLRGKRLWSDPALRALTEMRRDRSNSLVSHKLVVSLSSEAESNIRLAARVKVPSFLTLSADATKALKTRNEYTVTTEVTF